MDAPMKKMSHRLDVLSQQVGDLEEDVKSFRSSQREKFWTLKEELNQVYAKTSTCLTKLISMDNAISGLEDSLQEVRNYLYPCQIVDDNISTYQGPGNAPSLGGVETEAKDTTADAQTPTPRSTGGGLLDC
jgi:hypothetical protein